MAVPLSLGLLSGSSRQDSYGNSHSEVDDGNRSRNDHKNRSVITTTKAEEVEERLPDVLTEEEWQAFIGRFRARAPTGLRNRALFTLMHDAGLRTCEVIGLHTRDVKHDELDGRPVTRLELRAGKGGRQRSVYLPPEASRLLEAWVAYKRALGIGQSRRVFTALRRGPLASAYLREVCARKGREAGIEWRVHPHALRHTFGTELLEETGDLALVQDALGHANPTNTRIYAKVRNGRLARAMTQRQGRGQPDEKAQQIAALRAEVQALLEKIEALDGEE